MMDRRLIQTAVFGSSESDEPALCPETVEELDAFRLEHENDTIWCGTKFEGGCGRRLTTRRYTDKICHFAHYGTEGTGQQCARTAKGKDSANHLFAKAHLASWLRAHNLTAEFTYPEPLGSAVRAHLDDGRTFLVHLDRNRSVAWDDDAWEIVLGPGVPVITDILNRRGYVHRIRFEDRPGGGRVMRFGTEHPGQGTTWDSLDDVKLTPQGLNTVTRPDAVRAPLAEPPGQDTASQRAVVPVTRSQLLAVTAARQNDPVKRALLHLDRALRDQQDQVHGAINAIRQLLETSQTPENVGRLRIALSRGQVWTEQRARHRKAVVDQLKERTTYGLLLEAADLLKDPDATAEEREVVRSAHVRYEQEHATHQRAQAEQREAKQHQREAEQRQREVERRARAEHAVTERRRQTEAAERQAQAESLAYLAPFVFGALKKAAREGRTTTWEEIGQKTGQRQLGRLTHQDRLDLLEAIEKNTLPGNPLWSAVLSATGTSEALRLHRDISHLLHRPAPDSDSDLLTQLTADCAQLRRQ
ncbi:hypothetical protein [Streptomyces sp. NBC_01565]|uniref:hypothetical protein n=1 Tax=unclassified Streptomyces TaxID=2593676 RepID=UPI002251C376|nr:hypothetical protein [Streptomyces sp. NBC_01565]MCX4546504.1 hypothetical protein [Streptomyces sp. NBC_01565]